MIDRKFKFVAVNPCNNKYYTENDAVVVPIMQAIKDIEDKHETKIQAK